ncbi:unnamed protein product [Lota lota]
MRSHTSHRTTSRRGYAVIPDKAASLLDKEAADWRAGQARCSSSAKGWRCGGRRWSRRPHAATLRGASVAVN